MLDWLSMIVDFLTVCICCACRLVWLWFGFVAVWLLKLLLVVGFDCLILLVAYNADSVRVFTSCFD